MSSIVDNEFTSIWCFHIADFAHIFFRTGKGITAEQIAMLLPCYCYAVTVLLPCCCHAVTWFCTHILSHRKRNCRATVAMLLPCSCNTGEQQPFAWAYVGLSTCLFAAQEEELPLNILCRLCCQWKFPHVFAAQETELPLNNSWSSTFGPDYFLNDCQSVFW